MKYSLLYPDISANSAFDLPKNTLYHLSLDSTFAYICPDVTSRNVFCEVLSSPLTSEREICYRQEILHDFQSNPGFFDKLFSLYSRFRELKDIPEKMRRDFFQISVNQTSSLSAVRNQLQTNALCIKRALLFIKSFAELLSGATLRSEGLLKLLDGFREHIAEEPFKQMLGFCARFESFSEAGNLAIKVTLDENGIPLVRELTDGKYIHITDSELKKKGFSLFGKPNAPVYDCARLYPVKSDCYDRWISDAVSDLSEIFAFMTSQLMGRFLGIGRELFFYKVALEYIRVLSQKNIPICYPSVGESAKNTNIQNLYDLFLIMSTADAKSVVPNSFVMLENDKGILLFGDNGSGKTVYLRSVGTAQIMAQAGLPIPATDARITIYKQIITQFSEAEKEFTAGNEAGRFEQEVREIAKMIDTLRPGSLVFLNEIFQSTSYDEGAEGLRDILQYFSSVGIRWILVTHLRQLENLFSRDEARFLCTKNGHEIANEDAEE